jgi:hypothetical protein
MQKDSKALSFHCITHAKSRIGVGGQEGWDKVDVGAKGFAATATGLAGRTCLSLYKI